MQAETGTGAPPEFARVLEQYCLRPAEIEREDLVVPCRSVLILSASPRHASFRRPKVLHTTDLDQLKQWIGVPDAAVKGRCLLDRDQKADLAGLGREMKVSSAEMVQAARPAGGVRLDAVRAHARAYLYGDSTQIVRAKPLLEGAFKYFNVFVFAFLKIKVSSGSVLFLGPGPNVLLASELEIEEGGQVISVGPLTVRVGILRKTTPKIKYGLMELDHILSLVRA